MPVGLACYYHGSHRHRGNTGTIEWVPWFTGQGRGRDRPSAS